MIGARQRLLFLVLCFILGASLLWLQQPGSPTKPAPGIPASRNYTLEFWDYSLPLVWEDGTTYQEAVEEIIADFEAQFPNITIEHRFLSLLEGEEIFFQALKEGAVPDVYSEPFSQSLIYHRGLQVPLTGFIDKQELDHYHPRVLAGLEGEGKFWAWPAWVSPSIWAGNRIMMEKAGMDVAEVQTLGWNWDGFVQQAKGLSSAIRESVPIFLTGPGKKELYWSLLVSNYGSEVLTDGEDREVLTRALEETGEFLTLLEEEGLWHSRDDWLREFWQGRALFLGPVNTWVLRGTGLEGARIIDCAFLPVPHRVGDREYVEPVIAQVKVFRQKQYQGTGQIQAAMEFARFFSREQGRRVAPRLWALPAFEPWSLIGWEEDGLTEANIRFLLRSLDYLLPPPALSQEELAKWREESLDTVLAQFLAGELSAGELAEKLIRGLKDT